VLQVVVRLDVAADRVPAARHCSGFSMAALLAFYVIARSHRQKYSHLHFTIPAARTHASHQMLCLSASGLGL
ncbi:MAG: hypothetical protein ACREBE_23355, partial [bacterium]